MDLTCKNCYSSLLVVFSFPYPLYIYQLEFFCKEQLSLLHCQFLHLFVWVRTREQGSWGRCRPGQRLPGETWLPASSSKAVVRRPRGVCSLQSVGPWVLPLPCLRQPRDSSEILSSHVWNPFTILPTLSLPREYISWKGWMRWAPRPLTAVVLWF